jgi:hypothetical protein
MKNSPPKFYGPPLPPEMAKARRDESRRRWAQANPESARASKQKWADANRHVGMEITRRRQARKLMATPKWADRKAMQAIYKLARELSQSGDPHEVDHIVPLQGKNVCGLHCEANLRAIPVRANRVKANKLSGE